MKLRKRYMVFVFSLLSTLSGFGQNAGFYWNQADVSSNRLEGKLRGVSYYVTSLSNSKFFLQPDWSDGTVLLEDGDRFEGLKMRYLAYGDELVVYNDKLRTLFIIDKETVKEFSFHEGQVEQNFVKLNYNGAVKGSRYFHQLYTGSRSLLAFHFVESVKTSPYTDKFGVMRDTEYRMTASYFMHSGTDDFLRLQNKRRTFFKIFPENKNEIRKLFRKNGLTVFDEKGLIRAFKMLDEEGLLK